MNEILKKLQEPMEYKTKPGKGGFDQNYIDARQVMNRLDEVMGTNWQCDYKEVKGNVYCTISLKLNDEWIGRTDCGVESNFEKEKGESSDAFKRAAVKWGIGRFLYDPTLPKKGKSKPVSNEPSYTSTEIKKCPKCGATMKDGKYGKPYCYECWKKKQAKLIDKETGEVNYDNPPF